MKKNRKNHHAGRIISLFIVLCMVLSIAPITVFAEEDDYVIDNVVINNATLDYNVGEAPKATAQVTGDAAKHCAIEYECWEEIDENGKPLAFWYSDESQYNPGMTKITAFEAGKTYTYSLMVKAETGYVFGEGATLKINDIVVSNPIILNPPMPPEARIIGEQIKTVALPYYQVIEGANSAWTQNSDGTLVFRANGDFSKFTGVKVDGTLIDAKNYTAVSGSTVITLKADYLKTLSVGTHKLTVAYTDGECSTNYEVKQAASEQTTPTEEDKTETTTPTEGDKTETTTPTGGKDTTSPQTGDNSNMLLWVALLFVSGAGVIGTTVYSKKKRVR